MKPAVLTEAKEAVVRPPMFTPFLRLPLEIRLMVWKVACYHQRNIDIEVKYFGPSDEHLWVST
jgi:hypothetical protein